MTRHETPPTAGAPLITHRDVVRREWIDKNGHMTMPAYSTAFMEAYVGFLHHHGLGFETMETTGVTTFALDWRIHYRREAFAGTPLRFETTLVDTNFRLFHHATCLYDDTSDTLLAISEHMDACVSTATRKVTMMPDAIRNSFAALLEAHRDLPRPSGVGTTIGLRR